MGSEFWKDERGTVCAESILVCTILIIGCIVGLMVIRDAVVSRMAGVSTFVIEHAGAGVDQLTDAIETGESAAANSTCVAIVAIPARLESGARFNGAPD